MVEIFAAGLVGALLGALVAGAVAFVAARSACTTAHAAFVGGLAELEDKLVHFTRRWNKRYRDGTLTDDDEQEPQDRRAALRQIARNRGLVP